MLTAEFQLTTATPADIDTIVDFLIPAFDHYSLEQLLGNTTEHREAYGQRHLDLWQRQAKHSPIPCPVKCIHTDPSTGRTSIVGFCEWLIYPEPWTEAQIATTNYLFSASWIPDGDERRAKAQEMAEPIVQTRNKWMAGRPAAFLLYVCVPPQWRRRGIASRCVAWGLQQCAKYNVPAYLEASEDGAPVYRRLGFEEVDKVAGCPVMIWWPPGTPAADKKPAMATNSVGPRYLDGSTANS